MSINYLHRGGDFAGMPEGRPEKSSGFTLVELLITIAIVGILSGIGIPLYAGYIEKAKIIRAVAEITTVSKSITAYNIDNGKYPQSLAEVGYVSIIDPWGAQYRYLNIQTTRGNGPKRKDRFVVPINSDYDLYSIGRDGKSQPPLTARTSKDDVIRANDGTYIGLASAF